MDQEDKGFRVFVGFPHDGKTVALAAANAFYHPCIPGESPVRPMLKDVGGAAVLHNHNYLFSEAIDLYEAGECDAVAILHADVGANPGWLDTLYGVMQKTGADVVAANIPIKDDRGLTSTAVDDMDDPWNPRRLTMKQSADLPETFTDADVGGPLLLNTGMFLLKFGPWVLAEPSPIHFQFQTRITKRDGKRVPGFRPDDWDLSRMFHSLGLKLACTKAVKLNHYGEKQFPNFGDPWGWKEDWQNGPNAPHRRARKLGFSIGSELVGTKVITLGEKVQTISGGRHEDGDVIFQFEDGTECRMEECFPYQGA